MLNWHKCQKLVWAKLWDMVGKTKRSIHCNHGIQPGIPPSEWPKIYVTCPQLMAQLLSQANEA